MSGVIMTDRPDNLLRQLMQHYHGDQNRPTHHYVVDTISTTLVDLRHLCERWGIDYEQIDIRALDEYLTAVRNSHEIGEDPNAGH